MRNDLDLTDDAGPWKPSPWLEWLMVAVIAAVFAGAALTVATNR